MHLLFVRSICGIAAATALTLLSLGLSARPAQAQGTPDGAGYYTYTLSDVAFNTNGSGGTASGYFDYDPATGAIGQFDINTSPYTSGNDSFAGDEYTSANASASSDDVAFFTFEQDDYIDFLFLQTLSEVDGAGPYNLSSTEEGEAPTSTSNQSIRTGNTGTISGAPVASAVPELSPATAIGLLGVLGVGALGLARIKTRRVGASAA